MPASRPIAALLLLMTSVSWASAAAAKKPKPLKPSYPPEVRQWMNKLSLRQKVAQLVMVPFYGESPNTRTKEYRDYVALVKDLQVGGLIILNRVVYGSVKKAEPYAMAAFLNRMQKQANVPLIVGGDFERGASMRVLNTTQFPHNMAFAAAGDAEAVRRLGAITAREARALGVHWVYVPVADVNNNPDNPIINIRSFGEDPEMVAKYVRAYIQGGKSATEYPVLQTVKHFPGHGDTATDSHMGLGVVTADRARLDAMELIPFKAGIAAGVDAVMTAHLAVPALEPEPIPATVSKNILTGLLRQEMGFQGMIVTDAMDMQGLTKLFPPGEAAVRALEAGVDLLLIPTDPREAVKAVVAAVESGRITRERLDQSVAKVLTAKSKLNLKKKKYVDLEAIEDLLDTPEDQALAQQVAENALTLVKNEGNVLPLREPDTACFLVLGGNRFSSQGRDFAAAVRRRAPKARVTVFDPQLPMAEFDAATEQLGACQSIVVTTYVVASEFRGTVGLTGNYPAFMEKVMAAGKPVVFVSLGSPYFLRTYPNVHAYLAAFSTATPSELAAARALFGEVKIQGRMPVSIPGLAAIGAGLSLDKSR